MFGNPPPPPPPPSPPSHSDLVAQRALALEGDFAAGRYERFVWPYCLYGFYLVFAYLLLPPPTTATRSRLYRRLGHALCAFNVYWCVRSVLVCRSAVPPTQYGIGLVNCFACLWLGVHLVWKDPRTESSRIVWRAERPAESRRRTESGGGVVAAADDVKDHGRSSARADGSPVLVVRRVGGGGEEDAGKADANDGLNPLMHIDSPGEEYFWQPLPERFLERLYWVCTMILSLRGEGTTHGVRQLPSPPPSVRASLRRNSPSVPEPSWISDARTPLSIEPSRQACLLRFLRTWAVTYIVLDVSKFLISRDPYFTGFIPLTAPLPLPPSLVSSLLPPSLHWLPSNPIFAKASRLSLCCGAILALLTNFTAIPPLLASGLFGVRDQSWLYPTVFGDGYVTTLTSAGIAGWWGRWWHQLFRLSFEAPAATLCTALNISPRGTRGRIAGMLVAFALSAALHAAGSHTLNGPTAPWAGSGAFFLVQPAGIALEQAARAVLGRAGVAARAPAWTATLAAFVWVHFWMYHTAPLLGDDVARGGVWTTEVVPVSIVEGLAGNGWIRWGPEMLPRWYVDEKWWKSGIAF